MSMVDGLCNLIFNIYEAFTAAIYVREGDRLRCISSVTFANSFDRNRSLVVDESLPGWVIKHKEPLVIPNFDKDEGALGYYGAAEGIKSFMGYPMEGEGVIIVDSKKKYVFTDKEKKILGGFGDVVHRELERDKRSQEIEEKIEELNRERRFLSLFRELNQSNITVREVLKECADLSGADFCFSAIEKGEKVVVRDVFQTSRGGSFGGEHPFGGTIVSLVIEGGRELLLPHSSGFLRERPLFFQGESLKMRQLFGFPLVTEDQAFGVVGFVSTTDSRLQEASIGLLREVASLLSLYYASVLRKEYHETMQDVEPVSGALQFPAFLKLIDGTIKRDESFSLISVNLLDIQACNRKLGYEYTNKLLRKAFQVLRYCVGSRTIITRKGGGKFYALLKGNGILEVNNILKILGYTIRKSIAEEKLFEGMGNVETGLSRFPDDTRDLWELLDRASQRKQPGSARQRKTPV